MTKLQDGLNARVEAKRLLDARLYMEPRLRELEGLGPVLRAKGLEMGVREMGDRMVVYFHQPETGAESGVTIDFPSKRNGRSPEAKWSSAELEVSKSEQIFFADNGWCHYRNLGDCSTTEIENLPLDEIIELIAEQVVDTPVYDPTTRSSYSSNGDFAKAFAIVKEVVAGRGGSEVRAQRDDEGVEAFSFMDQEGREHRLAFQQTAKLFVDGRERGEAPAKSTLEIGMLVAKHCSLEYRSGTKPR